MLNRFKGESGSVTIEATISLSTFMFAIVTLLTIVNICVAQSKIGIAINSSAKELSQYSYLYAITGLNESEAALNDAATEEKQKINDRIQTVNDTFTEIQNLAVSVGEAAESQDLSGLLSQLEKTGDSAGELKATMEEIAKDPKGVAFGLLKVIGSKGLDAAKSRLIAAPLAKTLSKKNLVSEKSGDVDAYLKHLGVVPSANGSYIDGLDFSQSTIFPGGSNEIKICVSYDVKVIALLPIDFSFHFEQTAITQGWLCGSDSYKTVNERLESVVNNESIWISATISERSDLIRHQFIEEYKKAGYKQTKGLTDVPLYNPSTNEFITNFTMNPLYSAEGEEALTLEDINETVIKNAIEQSCGYINSSTKDRTSVEISTKDSNGNPKTEVKDCKNASRKIVLVIPEDEGLKEKIQSVLEKTDTSGVVVEIQASYGKGARQSVVKEGGAGE